MTEEIFVMILSKLYRLTTLKFDGNGSVGGSMIKNLLPNKTIEHLSLHQNNKNLLKIIQFATHIETLELFDTADSLYGLQKLKVIKNVTKNFTLNNLKMLKLNYIKDVMFLTMLLKKCPNINIIEFYLLPPAKINTILNILLKQKTLRHIIFKGFTLSHHRNIFNKLKINYGTLESIKFVIVEKSIDFYFPKNPKLWIVADQEARFSSYESKVEQINKTLLPMYCTLQ